MEDQMRTRIWKEKIELWRGYNAIPLMICVPFLLQQTTAFSRSSFFLCGFCFLCCSVRPLGRCRPTMFMRRGFETPVKQHFCIPSVVAVACNSIATACVWEGRSTNIGSTCHVNLCRKKTISIPPSSEKWPLPHSKQNKERLKTSHNALHGMFVTTERRKLRCNIP